MLIEIYEIPMDITSSETENNSESTTENTKIFCKIEVNDPIQDLKLNPNYLNVLLVGTYSEICFFIIPEKRQEEIIEKPKFIFRKIINAFYSAVFNPFNSHIIACSNYPSFIQIWSVKNPIIHKIDCLSLPINMKWEKSGNLLGFIDNATIIKIYDKKNKKKIFNLDLKEINLDFDFFGNNTILVYNKDRNKITEYEFSLEPENEVNEKGKRILEVKYTFCLVFNDYFLINSNEKKISLYSNFENIFDKDCFLKKPKIIKNANKKRIFTLLDRNYEKFKLVFLEDNYNGQLKGEKITNKEKKEEIKEELKEEIKEEKKEDKEENSFTSEYNSFDDSLEDLNKDYFEDCPEEFIDIIENINFKYNHYDDKYKKEKKYIDIKEIQISLEENKKSDLISLRNYVKKEMEKDKYFKSKKEEYLFYLNLLIKDETNITLLKDYLLFLKNNKTLLEKENIPHEKFEDELNYYSVFFEKDKLKDLFGYEIKSEKSKLVDLMNDYYNNLKKKTFKEFKKKIEKEYKRRYFNQPISFNSKELLYYDCSEIIYCDILNSKHKKKQDLENKLYILEKILRKNIIEKFEEADVLIPLFSFLSFQEPKENFDFFLNSICSKTLKDEEFEKKSLLTFECENGDIKKIFCRNKEYYENPNELCFENLDNTKYLKCEKYNYKHMIKYPPLNLKINKIKEFILITLKSKVFEEAFKYLTEIENYETIFNDNMISEFINNIKFLPIKFNSIAAFHDRLNIVTVISTMKKYLNVGEDNKEIVSTLENGVIVAIIYHEFGDFINAVISFMENKMKFNDKPKKRLLKFKEGGHFMELILFGKVIKHLSYEEVLYILNEDNYNKSLEDFRKGFSRLNDKDLTINGPFKDFNILEDSISDEIKKNTFIKIKNNYNINDILKNAKITIPLVNDVIGRKINIKDLEPYFH